jgi:hypothetical protein
MSEIKNAASTHDDAVGLLQDWELDAVNGGVTGKDQGCIPWRQPDGTWSGSNPWLGYGHG